MTAVEARVRGIFEDLEVPEGFKAELVSRTSAHRDDRIKREMYAGGTSPVHLIVDPIRGVCVLLTEPGRATASGLPDHLSERTTKFGEPVPVGLLGVTLDTSEFQTYA
ncbi:hypothetical protein OG689_27710 [Kitasatospora sp. NBC_00240]|uniref:hypothetical protein n=1 Tax=Kitasatospora sp. NBC_00240 TaxID=2903567 RepID=UPI00225B5620|nr:hypothetical protein [Kitasatospora sp. NBC_00240]MCX5213011.1 hypothetical protein [Kitasatospora sp. NBC_00240]